MDDQRLAAGVDQVLHRARACSSSSSGMRTGPDASTRSVDFEPQVARDDRHEDAGHAIGLRTGAAAEFDARRESRAW